MVFEFNTGLRCHRLHCRNQGVNVAKSKRVQKRERTYPPVPSVLLPMVQLARVEFEDQGVVESVHIEAGLLEVARRGLGKEDVFSSSERRRYM